MYRILLADDERKIRETLAAYLGAKGFSVRTCADGREAADAAVEERFDLVILDVMMPVMDGIAACREIKAIRDVPVLFLTALGTEEGMLAGFAAGGDDYIVKPFPLPVLVKKCEALIRLDTGSAAGDLLQAEGIALDLGSRTVTVDGAPADVKGKDFDLLRYLMSRPGRVLSRTRILNEIWGYDYEGEERVVDTHIKTIRRALGTRGPLIETVIGSGYRFRKK
ncbi:MAG: response regulator transcription factor [Eubacterium sp.]|nr:response regulator transcription factor [Eubacterium sp.]